MLNIGLGLIDSVVAISKRAGDEIMKVYNQDFDVFEKKDASPVTKADQISERLLLRSIREGISDKFPIISEEAAAIGHLPRIENSAFWLIDPLDGTKEFIKGNDEFTVNIAIIENGRPVLGIIHIPALGQTYWGSTHGSYLQKQDSPPEKLFCQPFPSSQIRVVLSRSHNTPDSDNFLTQYSVAEKAFLGSAIKFCAIAEGSADLYPRFSPTMEWDTAAGHAIIKFSGGRLLTLDGTELVYGKENFKNPDFVASGPGFEISS